MLGSIFGISCSRRCEQLLALAFIRDPTSVVSVAHRLANDAELSAVRLAMALSALPIDRAMLLARETINEN